MPDAPSPAAFFLAAALAFVLAAQPAAGAADLSQHKALLVFQSGDEQSTWFEEKVTVLRGALVAGGMAEGNVVTKGFPKRTPTASLAAAFQEVFGAPGANASPKLFWYEGHGGRYQDDAAPVDEGDPPNSDNQDEHMSPFGGPNNDRRDDDLATLWAGYTGPKILFYSQCSAGGLFDGTSDPRPAAQAYFLGVVPASQGTKIFSPFLKHALFGLAGYADAPLLGNGDGEVTADELRTYLDVQEKSQDFYDPVFDVVGATVGATVLANVPAAGPGTVTLPALDPFKGIPMCEDREGPEGESGVVGGLLPPPLAGQAPPPVLAVGLLAAACLAAVRARRRAG